MANSKCVWANETMDERSLICKLVTSWHLSVAERRALPEQTARVSEVCRAIADYLLEETSYPHGWTTEEGYDGGLIELKSDGSCEIHWMVEVSMMRFELQEIVHHDDALDAAKAWLKRMFPKDIDGVPLDWNA